MTQLTKEYFDQKLANVPTKEDLAVGLGGVQANLGDEIAELATITKQAFDGVDRQLINIVELLDVRIELTELKDELSDMKGKLESALNLKL